MGFSPPALSIKTLFRCQAREREKERDRRKVSYLETKDAKRAAVWQRQLAAALTCLCSDTVLQSAAVQMMSSPPAAASVLKMPHTYTAEGEGVRGRGHIAGGGEKEGTTSQS